MPSRPMAMALGRGLRQRSPSSAEGPATKPISARALSQIPRLNRAVFLKEMARMGLRESLKDLLPLRVGAGRIVQVRAEGHEHHGRVTAVAKCMNDTRRNGQPQYLACRHLDVANRPLLLEPDQSGSDHGSGLHRGAVHVIAAYFAGLSHHHMHIPLCL